jgi:hypothetical protein
MIHQSVIWRRFELIHTEGPRTTSSGEALIYLATALTPSLNNFVDACPIE